MPNPIASVISHLPVGRVAEIGKKIRGLGSHKVQMTQATKPQPAKKPEDEFSPVERKALEFLRAQSAKVPNPQAGNRQPAGAQRQHPVNRPLPVPPAARQSQSSALPAASNQCTPADICKQIRGNTEEYGFRLYAPPVKRTTDNPKGLGGMEQLRQGLRAVHGYSRSNAKGDIAKYKPDSPLAKMLNGELIYIWREKSETHFSTIPPQGRQYLKLDGNKVLEAQKNVQIWTQEDKITSDQVKDIQKLKRGDKLHAPKGKKLRAYKEELERKSEHVVTRSTAFMTHRPDGTLLDEPREHIIYHACYPRLNSNSPDQRYFATGKTGSAVLIEGRKNELKDRYKAVVLQQLKVASHNGEDIDLLAPNAFLYGLKKSEQAEAKKLFQQAVNEAAREAKNDPGVYGGLKAIYVHMGEGIADDVKDFVFHNPGDAFSPDRIGQEKGGRRVAVCIMSDGIGPVGNGALGNRALKGMEENTARLCTGTVEATGPAFNDFCFDSKNRYDFTTQKKVQQPQADRPQG